MELGGGGDSAARSARLSSDDAAAAAAAAGEEDRLSTLPDDVLVLILLKLSTRAAAQTSVLSRRWRRVWALLPVLRFTSPPEPHRRGPAKVEDEEQAAQRGAFQFPCFEKATSISLVLAFQASLAVPPAGVFTRLTELHLSQVWFHGPGELGDAVSLLRCPCLQRLTVDNSRGLADLFIHSESLLVMVLRNLRSFSQLTVVAPTLKELTVGLCFFKNRPIANISAPRLMKLDWVDGYGPSSVHLARWNISDVWALAFILFIHMALYTITLV